MIGAEGVVMVQAFKYHVLRNPDGEGWIVTAEGHVARSLPYDTLEQAVELADDLVRQYPGSTLLVEDHPPALTPVEIEHRIAA